MRQNLISVSRYVTEQNRSWPPRRAKTHGDGGDFAVGDERLRGVRGTRGSGPSSRSRSRGHRHRRKSDATDGQQQRVVVEPGHGRGREPVADDGVFTIAPVYRRDGRRRVDGIAAVVDDQPAGNGRRILL